MKIDLILLNILERLNVRDLLVTGCLSQKFNSLTHEFLSQKMSIVFMDKKIEDVFSIQTQIPVNQVRTIYYFMDDENVKNKSDLKEVKQLEITLYGDSADKFVLRIIDLLNECPRGVNLSLTFSFRRHAIAFDKWEELMETVRLRGINLVSIQGRSVLYSQQIEQLVKGNQSLKHLRCCLPNKKSLAILASLNNLVSVHFHSRDTPGRDHEFSAAVMSDFLGQQFGKKLKEFRLHVCLSNWKRDEICLKSQEIATRFGLTVDFSERASYSYSQLPTVADNVVFSCNFLIQKKNE